MANELDKTIEELEAEVRAEIEEAMHDAPKKSAVTAEIQHKLDKVDGDEIQDTGDSPSKPMDKTNPTAKAVAKAKVLVKDKNPDMSESDLNHIYQYPILFVGLFDNLYHH